MLAQQPRCHLVFLHLYLLYKYHILISEVWRSDDSVVESFRQQPPNLVFCSRHITPFPTLVKDNEMHRLLSYKRLKQGCGLKLSATEAKLDFVWIKTLVFVSQRLHEPIQAA